MKVAILVADWSEDCGDARVAQLQVVDMLKEGNKVSVFALGGDMGIQQGTDLFLMGMPQNLLLRRAYRLFFPLDIIKAIKWLPRLKQYDIIIAHLYPMSWFGCLAKLLYKVNYTFWYHGLPGPKYYPHWYEKVYLLIDIFLTRLTVQNVDRPVSVSNFARNELKRYTGKYGDVVYNRTDTSRFRKGLDRKKIRQKQQLGDAPVILYVGQISPRKGIHLLIESFQLVKQELPDAKLVIVGTVTFGKYMEKLIKVSDDSVIFAGYVTDELPYYYSMCDICASGSLWETFNLFVLEAQASGKPIVAFDIEPFREGVDETGILVEVGNTRELGQACIKKLREVRQDIS